MISVVGVKPLRKDNAWLVIVAILLQTIFMVFVNNNILTSNDLSVLKDKLPYINIGVIVLCVLNIAAIKNIEIHANYRSQALLLKNHLKQIESLVLTSQSQRHEYARHIQSIQALVELDLIKEARDYINGISASYWADQEMFYFDNPALSGLLNSKISVAQLSGIDFAITVKCDLSGLKVPAWDLCSIIGNLIDNSFEAASHDKEPRVGIEFKYENEMYAIYILNNGPPVPRSAPIFEAGYTTKGSEGRGFGLYIVKKLVDKHKGSIEIYTMQRTTTILRLPGGTIISDRNAS